MEIILEILRLLLTAAIAYLVAGWWPSCTSPPYSAG